MNTKILNLYEITDKISIPKDLNNLRDLTEICKFIKNVDIDKQIPNEFYLERTDFSNYIRKIIEKFFIKTSFEWKNILSKKDLKIFNENSLDLFKDYQDILKENSRCWFRKYERLYNRIYYIRVMNENKFICLQNSFSSGQIHPNRFLIKDHFVLFLTCNIFKKDKKFHNQLNKFTIDLLDYSVKLEQRTFIENDFYDCNVFVDTEFIKEFSHLGEREIIQYF